MTRKTGIPGLLAGGICSLTLAGAASADHVLKICEICEAGPGNAHQWISRSGGGDTENVIVIELDGEDGRRVLNGEVFDFDFDFDWVGDLHDNDCCVIIKKRIERAPRRGHFTPEARHRTHRTIQKRHRGHGGEHEVIIERLGGPHRGHRSHGGQGDEREIKIIIDGEHIDLGGLHELHELKRHGGGKAHFIGKPRPRGGGHEVIIKRLGGGDHFFIGKPGTRGGEHEVIIERFGGGDFSLGDLGLDERHGEVRIKVLIDGDTIDLHGLDQLKGLMELKGLKGLKKRFGGGAHFIGKPGSDGGKHRIIIKTDGKNVWKSIGGEAFDLSDDDNVMFFSEGLRSMGDIGVTVDSDDLVGIEGIHLALGGADSDDIHAWTVADDNDAHENHGPRVMIGITLGSISEALAMQLGVDAENVVMIESVLDGMPAERFGLRRFDIITGIDGHDQISTPILQRIIAGKSVGDEVLIRILRGGDPHTFTVELAAAPAPEDNQVLRERAVRGQIRDRQRVGGVERDHEHAKRVMQRAKERFEQQRDAIKLRKERGGADIEKILRKLDELEFELDDETMAQIKAHLSQLGERFGDFDFTFEMPNIEFFPGENDDDVVVVIEGAPAEKFFERFGNTMRFAPGQGGKSFTFPGGEGEIRWEFAPGEAPLHAPAPGDVFLDRNQHMTGRLDSLEERMERIEKLLERLVDRID